MAQPAVLVLPGLLEDADAFAHQIAALKPLAECLVADLTRHDTMAGLAADALAQAPAGPLSVIGHSMGGYVALELMRQAPGRVERLALLNTNARPDSEEATANRKRLMALAEKDFPAVIGTLLPKLLRAERLPELSGVITGMALATGREAFLRQERAIIRRIDSRPHLAAIRCPTLVIAGDDDQLMPVEILRELADGIPGAKLRVIQKCGHMASIERPKEVSGHLVEWARA